MRRYLALASHREARWPLLTSTLSRLTPGMIALALVLMSRQAGYSYAVAGAVTAAHQIGTGLGSPLQGKLVDRFGQRVVLVPDAFLYAAGTALLALLATVQAPVAALLAAAVLTGAFYPPTTACSRVVLSRLFPTGELRETAFALSSIAVELGFIAGPLAATAVATTFGARWAVILAGVFALIGALGFSSTGASRRAARRDVAATGRGSALRSPAVVVMVGTFVFVAVVFGSIDVVLPAIAEFAGQPEATGSLIASIAGGSLVGGLVYGSRSWPGALRDRLRVLITVLAVSLALVPLALPSLTPFRLALFVGGLALGPVTIVAFQLIDDLALPGTQTEAQSWTQSAVVFGVAGGAAAAGQLVEAASPELALYAGAASVGIGALIVFAFARFLAVPDRVHVETGPDAELTFDASAAASSVGLVTPTHLGGGEDVADDEGVSGDRVAADDEVASERCR